MKAKYIHPKTEKDILDKAIMLSCVAFSTVLRDKLGHDAETVQEAAGHVNYLIDSINKGYVDFDDLVQELEKDGIYIVFNDTE